MIDIENIEAIVLSDCDRHNLDDILSNNGKHIEEQSMRSYMPKKTYNGNESQARVDENQLGSGMKIK